MKGNVDVTDPRRTDEMFRGLVESAPDAMVIVDMSGSIVLVNAQTERLFGYLREELLGQPVEVLVPDRFHDRHRGHRSRYFTDPHPRPMGAGLDLFGRRKDGSEFPVEISLSPLETADGTLTSSAIRDVSDRKRAEAAASHFAAVVESSSDAIIGKTLDGIVMSWNAGAERLFGYSADEIRGKSISVLVPPGHDDDLPNILDRVRAGERVENLETVRGRKDGTHVKVSLTVSPIRDAHGNVVGASTIARDVSGLVRYREQLRFLAEHDALTGTRNRRRFEQDLSEQLGRARRYNEQAAVLVVDLDGFKQINDRYGHKTGDRALKAVAAALRRRLRDADIIARLGGDEFGVLLPYATAEQAAAIAADLQRVVAEASLDVDGKDQIHASISIGVAVIDKQTVSDDEVLAAADRAMYQNKRRAAGTSAGAFPEPRASAHDWPHKPAV